VVSLFGGRLDSLLIEKGMLLERGQRVAVVKEGDEPLEAFVFVPDEQGKQLKKGMKVFRYCLRPCRPKSSDTYKARLPPCRSSR
jgi:hypothetical protein